jgi:hypothetical protein
MKKRLLMGKLRVLLVCLGLEIGVLAGVPVRPEEIQELLHQMNQPQIVQVLRSDTDGDQ